MTKIRLVKEIIISDDYIYISGTNSLPEAKQQFIADFMKLVNSTDHTIDQGLKADIEKSI